MVAVVLSDDLLTVKLPKASVMIAACSDEVRTIGAEGTVPNPSLVASECGFERERSWFTIWTLGFHLFDLPDLCGMIRAACCQFLDVGREENAGDVVTAVC